MTYFSFQELERSATATKFAVDNTAPESARRNMAVLVDKVLDPLRKAWGKPLTVNSGYRCPQLNRLVGGSATSHHLKGMAADITTGNATDNRRLYQLAQTLGLPFTQLIGKKYNFGWIHIGYDPSDNRRQLL